MNPEQLIDRKSYAAALIAWILGFLLFYSDTYEFFSSFLAALLLAALVWVSYIMLRWLILAFRK